MVESDYRDLSVETAGLGFHLTERGPATGRPLLCLHGVTQTAHSWDEFAAAAAHKGYRALCLDQRGHGNSDWAGDGDYSRHTQADDIDALIAVLGLENPVVVAMSMGGLNAMTWASRANSRPLALVLVDISPEVRVEGVSEIRDFIQANDVLPAFDDFVDRAHAFNPRRSLDNIRSRLTHNLKRLDDGRWTWKYDPKLRNPGASIGEIASLWDEIGRIACPTLAVKGGESNVVSDESIARLVSTIPDCTSVEIAGAGHSVMGDRPEEFARAVLGFLFERLGQPDG